MESGRFEALRKSRTKKIVSSTKLTLPSDVDYSLTNGELIFPPVYPNQATISMEIRHQGLPDVGIDFRYLQEGAQFHPAYRQRAQSTGSNFRQVSPNCVPQNFTNSPKMLPGYHCSSAFRSGSFFEPGLNQNYGQSPQIPTFVTQVMDQNVYKQNTEEDYSQRTGRSRTYAMGNTKRPYAKNLSVVQQFPNTNSDTFDPFEAFEEVYNSNFVDNEYKFQDHNQVNEIPFNGDVGGENFKAGMQQQTSILDCNIADVIKKELEIDGTLDFI